jgi:hypothetical protein
MKEGRQKMTKKLVLAAPTSIALVSPAMADQYKCGEYSISAVEGEESSVSAWDLKTRKKIPQATLTHCSRGQPLCFKGEDMTVYYRGKRCSLDD